MILGSSFSQKDPGSSEVPDTGSKHNSELGKASSREADPPLQGRNGAREPSLPMVEALISKVRTP